MEITLKRRCGEIVRHVSSADPHVAVPECAVLCASAHRRLSKPRAREAGHDGAGSHKVFSRSKPLDHSEAGCCGPGRAARLPLSRWRLNKLALLTFALRLCLTAADRIGRMAAHLPVSSAGRDSMGHPDPRDRGGDHRPVRRNAGLGSGQRLQRAALNASFTADRWGGRAETIRIHAQEYVRTHGRRPEGQHLLNDIYTGSPVHGRLQQHRLTTTTCRRPMSQPRRLGAGVIHCTDGASRVTYPDQAARAEISCGTSARRARMDFSTPSRFNPTCASNCAWSP